MTEIRSIEINFEAPIRLTRSQEKALHLLASEICRHYEATHPDRIMWPFGFGAKLLVHPAMLSDDEPIPFDDCVLEIECAERERYETDRPAWSMLRRFRPFHGATARSTDLTGRVIDVERE